MYTVQWIERLGANLDMILQGYIMPILEKTKNGW